MNRVLKSMAIGLSLIAGSQAMDGPEEYLRNCSSEIQALVCETTAVVCFNEMSYSDSLEKLYFLMKNFCYECGKYTVNGNWFKNAILSGYAANGVCESDYENCLLFLNGKLIYTTDQGKKIVLPIANLKNPFSGEFDLSKCGEAGKYLSINTGCRKGKITENSNKVEIWFTPWFSVEKNLKGTAPHLEPIFTDWNHTVAPIGIFWNWGNCDNLGCYDYLTTCDLNSISSDNLLNLYIEGALVRRRPFIPIYIVKMESCGKYHVHFKQKLD